MLFASVDKQDKNRVSQQNNYQKFCTASLGLYIQVITTTYMFKIQNLLYYEALFDPLPTIWVKHYSP